MKKSVFYMQREVCDGTVMLICACNNCVQVCAKSATPQFKPCNKIVLTDPVTSCQLWYV